MAKNNKPNHDNAAEYLARVEWENQQSQRRVPLPWHMTPRWKYQKADSVSASQEKKMNRVWQFMGIALVVVCAVIAYFLGATLVLPFLIAIFFFVAFFWLAVRDASKKPRDND